jgi:hypothetical protein
MAVTLTFATGKKLVIDAATSQHHERNAEITKHPVEQGADITDHIRPMPNGLNISGVISSIPLGAAGVAPTANRHKEAFDQLDLAISSRTLVKVQTGLKTYENMAIRHIAFPREAQTGTELYFTIELVEVLFATTKTSKVPKDALGAKPPGGHTPASSAAAKKTQQQATNRNVRGNVTTKPPTAKQTARAAAVGKSTQPKSALKSGLTALGFN